MFVDLIWKSYKQQLPHNKENVAKKKNITYVHVLMNINGF